MADNMPSKVEPSFSLPHAPSSSSLGEREEEEQEREDDTHVHATVNANANSGNIQETRIPLDVTSLPLSPSPSASPSASRSGSFQQNSPYPYAAGSPMQMLASASSTGGNNSNSNNTNSSFSNSSTRFLLSTHLRTRYGTMPSGSSELLRSYSSLSAKSSSFHSEDDLLAEPSRVDNVEAILQKNFREVIRPMALFLCTIGWRPLPFVGSGPLWTIFDVLYLAFVLFLITFSHSMIGLYAFAIDKPEGLSDFFVQCATGILVWFFGLWFFRRQDGKAFDEISGLIDTVFLKTPEDERARLQKLLLRVLLGGVVTILMFFALDMYSMVLLTLDYARIVELTTAELTACLVALLCGSVFDWSVEFSTLVVYWIICSLHVYYLRSVISSLLSRKSALPVTVKDLAIESKLLNDLNTGWSYAVSLLTFCSSVKILMVQVDLIVYGEVSEAELVVKILSGILNTFFVFICILPAAYVTYQGSLVKHMSWRIRADAAYLDSTLADIDSFLNFAQHTPLDARLCGLPVFKEFVFIIIIIAGAAQMMFWETGLYT